MSIQRYRAQQAKPMTRSETIKFLRTYIKNMSDAYYSSGRTMEWANKFKGDDLIAEYNKIKSAVERSTTSQGVKRSGPTLEPGSLKKMKSTAGPSLGSTPADAVPADAVPADTGVSTNETVPADQSVPADTSIPAGTCVSAEDATTTIPVNAPLDEDEPAEESSFLRRSTQKKSVAKKRSTPPSSSIPFSTDDPDAAHTAQQHHDQATGGSIIYEHPPIPNPATPPVTEAAVNEPSSFVTPSKTTAADSSQNEDISPSTMAAAQILTGGKLDPSKISKSPTAVAQRSVQTFVRKRSSKSTQGLDYSNVDFSPRDSVATDSSIPAEKVVPADKGVSDASSNKGKGIADELRVPQRKQ
nr:hypothetical protein [Tanacetum cinerariifolium]